MRPVLAVLLWLNAAASAGTLTISPNVAGTTPSSLGYNLGHFMPGSNAADWFRYSGADAARMFLSVADMEPADDLPPHGDGVSTEAGFFARRALLRANASSPTETLDPSLVDWNDFTTNLTGTTSGNNKIHLPTALAFFRSRGIAVLANLTATPSRFPITGETDWAGKWELWQHYFAHAFLLARDHRVRRFSMFNEPNNWDGMTEADWLRRHRICSDAIQSALTAVNLRHGTRLMPEIFAANTANGAEKYNTIGADEASTNTWGHDAVSNRHLQLDGTVSNDWMNLHVYNYQKYTTRTHASGGLSGYVTDFDLLRAFINADMPGEPRLPMALTEFNVRTGASYDLTTATQDSPTDFAALGANCIALTERGIDQLYLFKFAQTASTSTYGVAKNGTHYVQNSTGGAWKYGGATQCAEVYRLFIKASRGGRPRMAISAESSVAPTSTGGLWSQATRDPATGNWHVFLANKEASALPLDIDFRALGLPADQVWMVEEVSDRSRGGTMQRGVLSGGRINSILMPAQSVRLYTLPAGAVGFTVRTATGDCNPSDGAGKNLTSGAQSRLFVRSDGTINSRRAALIRIPLPPGPAAAHPAVVLELDAATTSGTIPVQAHVYGITNPSWDAATATWAGQDDLFLQNIPAGNRIENNFIKGQGAGLVLLGQLTVDSPSFQRVGVEVTEFAHSRQDGEASFLIVQEHRWDVAQPSLTSGDTQPAGIVIRSRAAQEQGPALVAFSVMRPWLRWRQDHFPNDGTVDSLSGPTADPDGDGMVNLLEYALGGDPHSANGTGVLPMLKPAGEGLVFELRRNPGRYDLDLVIETAPDPAGPWSPAAASSGGRAFIPEAEGAGLTETPTDGLDITVRLTSTPALFGRRFFGRLRVVLKEEG